MNKATIQEKIDNLEQWLINNPHHPDYCLFWQDKEKLKKQLLKLNIQ